MTYILQFDNLINRSLLIRSGTDKHTHTIMHTDIAAHRPNLPLGGVKIRLKLSSTWIQEVLDKKKVLNIFDMN